jgi:dTDP-4-dehydrorhamnose reductase
MTERPFIHKKAFKDFKTNFIFQDEIAKILFKILTFKGILNLGGKSQSVYNFARKFNPKIKPVSIKNSKFLSSYPDVSMNTDKIKRIINA